MRVSHASRFFAESANNWPEALFLLLKLNLFSSFVLFSAEFVQMMTSK